MTAAGPPTTSGEQQRSTKRILSTASLHFSVQRSSHWSCRSSQSCALRTPEGTSHPSFPKLPPNFSFFFSVAFHGYTIGPPTTSTVSLFKRKKSCPAHISLFQSGLRGAVTSIFFFWLFLFSNPFLFFAADTCWETGCADKQNSLYRQLN